MSFEVKLKILVFRLTVLTVVISNSSSSALSLADHPGGGEYVGRSSSFESHRRSTASSSTGDLSSEEVARHVNINATESVQPLVQPGSQEYWREVRKQNKDLRLNAIKYFVMQSLYPSKLPPRAPAEQPNIFGQPSPLVPFSGQLQRLRGTCDVPTSVDDELWRSTDFFHIYFNLPSLTNGVVSESHHFSPSSPEEESNESVRTFQTVTQTPTGAPHQSSRFSSVKLGSIATIAARKGSNVVSAKLLLYKLGRGLQEVTNTERSYGTDALNQTADKGLQSNYPNVEVAEEKIRVSIYWYTSPLKKHHYKKKLLDTKMIAVRDARWVEFDIQRAAVAWMAGRPNFGLVVQVENEDNDWVDARKFFASLHCPNMAVGNSSFNFSNETEEASRVMDLLPPPELEICTLSVPSSESSEAPSKMATKSGQNIRVHHRRHRHSHGEAQSRLHRRNGGSVGEITEPLAQTSELPATLQSGAVAQSNGTDGTVVESGSMGGGARNEDDHPLRDILATVATRKIGETAQKRRHKAESADETTDYVDYYDNSEESDDERDVIIQKIFISPPDTSRKHHRRTQGQRSPVSHPFPGFQGRGSGRVQTLNR